MSQSPEEEPSDLFVASETTKAKRQFSRRANKISTAYENFLTECRTKRWLRIIVGGLPEFGLAAEADMHVGMEDFIFESGAMFSDATNWLSGYPASQSLAHELLFPMLTAMVPRTWLDLPHALREKLMTDSRHWLLLRSVTQTEESWKLVRQWKRRLVAAHETHSHSLNVLMNEHMKELQRLIQQAVMGTAALVSMYLQCSNTRFSGLEIPEALRTALPVSVIGHSTTPETLSIPYEFAEMCVQRQLLLNHKSNLHSRKTAAELGREESGKRFFETLPEVDMRNIPNVTEFVQTVAHELNHIIVQLGNQFNAYKHLSNQIEIDIAKSDKPETNFTQIRAWAQHVLNTTAIPHDAKMLKQTSLLFGRIINSISATLNITVTGKHLVKCKIISSDPALGKRNRTDKPKSAKLSIEDEIKLCEKKINKVVDKVPVWRRQVEQLKLMLASQTNNNNNSLENSGNRSSNEIDDLDPASPLIQPTSVRVTAPSRPRDASPKRPAPPPPLSTVPVPKQPSRAILPTLPKKRPVHVVKGVPLFPQRRPQLQPTDQSSDQDSNNSLEDEQPATAVPVLSQPSRQQAHVASSQFDAHDNISDF